ncbi:hypothetical protein A3B42_04235 [Candidatus Daviesbacteria bacterium RIFCSPLOWO2_01_FULL_38_10]|uniref:Bifunctional protein FolD n=1 Tax=Candidatus Daviesbacteria bacterium GW2011_GWF2_38_6 TaxID=1618432 RepID=A0A0G0KJQ1_9BACT|nr:MAG: Bifunctional protein FolD [Candidatus Daviesbacteria bacterium GW2011_GWA2_38_17]KKQ79022.1 MAG: Bifunctional protein FolD [Candidatus Daviesbacteria bacterium GW2011_GWF2_38_6]OGE26071.1 MAG: hypothetical protein A3D02_03515 [Candidatus Daviesbacteria bacterium RIFCSPHIGHO2_02_FULL_39_41]OGE40318.1 MAG: hypothetical protein A3B42_04235 [Candidatus Daviesbacteria bacterium RIFCSPLOWO2_01_FULL_38_10]OGE44883.1 MAG: hypothetical protein A3E67_00545 [Candidatus Daviesbacteria bacterium RIF
MKVSGKEVADAILEKLEKEIKKKNLKPKLAIILAGSDPSSRIYVKNKIKKALQTGIDAKLFEFSKNQFNKCFQTIKKLNTDKKTHGIIVQYPVYESWDFDSLVQKINPQKDVDGFLEASPFMGATALAVWEMLTAFAKKEGFYKTENFLRNKKIVILGKGKTAGRPTIELLKEKGIELSIIDSKTPNPNKITKKADVVISATGIKHIINSKNIKKGSFVIGVGVGKDNDKIYGDIDEEEVAKIAKLYCPTIGGIGPLTIVCLLRNVVKSANGII